jgi:hypothetical protein
MIDILPVTIIILREKAIRFEVKIQPCFTYSPPLTSQALNSAALFLLT